jgi:hypothetical protein
VTPAMPATTGHMPAATATWTHAHVTAAAATAHVTAAAVTAMRSVSSLREAWGCHGQRHCKCDDGRSQYWFEIEHIRNSVS